MNALESMIASGFEGAMSYKEYREKIDRLHEEGKVTGPNQTEDLLVYSKLNVHRMDRWDKHTHLSDHTKEAVGKINKPFTFLVLTEGWCGDAAQIVPVIQQIANLNSSIQTKYILRDENLEIMDMFLTGTGRSIPIFILIDENGKVVGHYGPRPHKAQELINQLKAENADMDVIKEKLHLWYARDKHHEVEMEFVQLLEQVLV
ncbi:MAG: thioredoxin family protein [Flavobacteriales bacterium]